MALSFTLGDKPKLPPIINVISEKPRTEASSITLLNFSEGNCWPSIAKTITNSRSNTLDKIRSPSFDRIFWFSNGLALSGVFSSAN